MTIIYARTFFVMTFTFLGYLAFIPVPVLSVTFTMIRASSSSFSPSSFNPTSSNPSSSIPSSSIPSSSNPSTFGPSSLSPSLFGPSLSNPSSFNPSSSSPSSSNPSSSNPTSSNPSNPASPDNTVTVIISAAVGVVILIILLVIATFVCFRYRRSRQRTTIENIQNAAYDGSMEGPTYQLPSVVDSGVNVYEEPAEYAQLESSKRDPVSDGDYQGLIPITSDGMEGKENEVLDVGYSGDYVVPGDCAQVESSKRDTISDGNYQSLTPITSKEA